MLATLLFHVIVVVILASLYLRYSPSEQAERKWPPVDSSEVLFGGEFVMTGDSPEPCRVISGAGSGRGPRAYSPAPQAPSVENTGTPAPTPAPVVTSERPSPAKVIKETPKEPTGPTKAEIEAAERAKREAETRQQIANKVQFGKSGTGSTGQGKAGSTNGNSSTGALSGTPGFNLKGRTMDSWSKPQPGPLGTITVKVSVNRQGQVTEASYQSGTGAAAANASTRQNCVNAARAFAFLGRQ